MTDDTPTPESVAAGIPFDQILAGLVMGAAPTADAVAAAAAIQQNLRHYGLDPDDNRIARQKAELEYDALRARIESLEAALHDARVVVGVMQADTERFQAIAEAHRASTVILEGIWSSDGGFVAPDLGHVHTVVDAARAVDPLPEAETPGLPVNG